MRICRDELLHKSNYEPLCQTRFIFEGTASGTNKETIFISKTSKLLNKDQFKVFDEFESKIKSQIQQKLGKQLPENEVWMKSFNPRPNSPLRSYFIVIVGTKEGNKISRFKTESEANDFIKKINIQMRSKKN